MNITNTAIPEVKIIDPDVPGNSQRLFPEAFDLEAFRTALANPIGFAQEIRTHTEHHQLIGLHYQIEPHTRGCLVYVENGQIFQVAVNLRKSSPGFSRWVATVLAGDNGYRFRIPEGFACGMLTLSDFVDTVALTTKPYDENSMRCIRRDDPSIAIDWHGVTSPRVSPHNEQGGEPGKADVFS